MFTKKKSANYVKARQRSIQEGPPRGCSIPIDHKGNYVIITIEQVSQYGVQEDKVNFYMDKDRMNSWNIKHNGIMQIHDSGDKLFRAGTHRALVWIAKNIFHNIRRIDE
jgi:hypothetical protein